MFGVKMPFIGGFVLYIHNHDKHDKNDDYHDYFVVGKRDVRRETWDMRREVEDTRHVARPARYIKGYFPPTLRSSNVRKVLQKEKVMVH